MQFTDNIPLDTTYVSGSVTASSGAAAYNGGLSRIEWSGILRLVQS